MITKKILFLVIVMLLQFISVYAQIPDKDLIAYWSFDDSTAADNSGHGYNGTLINNPIPDIGVKGACFRFKGKDAYIEENQDKSLIGDHIIIPRIPLEQYPEFTISMWVSEEKLEFLGGSGYIFFGEVFKAWAGIYHAGHYPDPTLWIKFSTGSINDVDEPLKLDYMKQFNNRWMYYALVYKNGMMKAYFNGHLIGTKYQPVLISGNRSGIATNWWYYDMEHRQSAAFTGKIDEVKIYKRALTEEELNSPCKTYLNFPNFFETNRLVLVENAHKSDSVISLTANTNQERGAVWFDTPVYVDDNFWTEFSFKFTDGKDFGNGEGSEPGADGIAFVMQNQGNHAIGIWGGDIGYGKLSNAVAIEYDTYFNGRNQIEDYGDPNGNHIALQVSHNGIIKAEHTKNYTLAIDTSVIKIKNGTVYYSRIEYDYKHKNLKVYLSKDKHFIVPVIDYSPIDLTDYINSSDNSAYIGFTSATGSSAERHHLLNWKFCSQATPIADIEQKKELSTMVVPNPADDYISVNLNQIQNRINNAEIYNYQGIKLAAYNYSQLINLNKGNMLVFDISDYQTGVYFIRLTTDFNHYVTKFLKK